MTEKQLNVITSDDPFWLEMNRLAATHPSEHERLRSAVVEAAKEWRVDFWLKETALIEAVDALNVFEAEHKAEESK